MRTVIHSVIYSRTAIGGVGQEGILAQTSSVVVQNGVRPWRYLSGVRLSLAILINKTRGDEMLKWTIACGAAV
jgi:hypothetical protein